MRSKFAIKRQTDFLFNQLRITTASERMVTASDLRAVLNASKYGRKVKSHSDRPRTFADISFTSAKNSSFSFGER